MLNQLIKYALLTVGLIILQESSYAQFAVSEKVVLSTDRQLYLTGEKVLFYANVFIEDDKQSNLSKILYLEIFKENKAFVQAKFRIEEGRAQGFLQLPDELLSGNYYLRAYTMKMRNGEPENYFNTLIRIVNPERKLHEILKVHHKIIEVMPQGGIFVNGLENNACIRFNFNSQKDIENAIVVNSSNDTLSEVRIFENGMGSFTFKPKTDENAWLKIALKSGDSTFIKLQKAENSGLFLRLDKQSAKVKVFTKGKSKIKAKLYLYNYRFEEKFNSSFELNDSLVRINLTNVMFEEGINYLVLKDVFDKVFYVHPFFIYPKNKPQFSMSLNKQLFGNREESEIEIQSSQAEEFVISVVKKGTVLEYEKYLPSEFIFNPLLLNDISVGEDFFTSDVSKQIELSFLLNQKQFNTTEFKNKFSSEPSKEWLPEIRDLSLSGKIINKNTGEPIEGLRVFASVLGGQPQLHSYLSDKNGEFIFSLNQLEGLHDVALSVDSIENTEAEIIVLSDFSNRFPAFADFPLQLDTLSKSLLEETYRNYQIGFKFQQIILSENDYPDPLPYPVQDAQSTTVLNDFIELPTMQEVFNEIVTYVNVRKRGGNYYINVLNASSGTNYNQPLILVDNLPIFDVNKVMKIDPALVEKIEVITRPYSLGTANFKGIVMITTKTDNFAGLKLPDETVFFKYSTASLSSKQIFPLFGEKNSSPLHQPYFSNTIFWDTQKIAERGSKKITFFTSDESGEFEIRLKVINSNRVLKQTIVVE